MRADNAAIALQQAQNVIARIMLHYAAGDTNLAQSDPAVQKLLLPMLAHEKALQENWSQNNPNDAKPWSGGRSAFHLLISQYSGHPAAARAFILLMNLCRHPRVNYDLQNEELEWRSGNLWDVFQAYFGVFEQPDHNTPSDGVSLSSGIEDEDLRVQVTNYLDDTSVGFCHRQTTPRDEADAVYGLMYRRLQSHDAGSDLRKEWDTYIQKRFPWTDIWGRRIGERFAYFRKTHGLLRAILDVSYHLLLLCASALMVIFFFNRMTDFAFWFNMVQGFARSAMFSTFLSVGRFLLQNVLLAPINWLLTSVGWLMPWTVAKTAYGHVIPHALYLLFGMAIRTGIPVILSFTLMVFNICAITGFFYWGVQQLIGLFAKGEDRFTRPVDYHGLQPTQSWLFNSSEKPDGAEPEKDIEASAPPHETPDIEP